MRRLQIVLLGLLAVLGPACGDSAPKKSGSSGGGGGGAPPPPPTSDTILPTSSGSIPLGPSTDFIPLYNGQVLIGDEASSRVNLVNVVTGAIDDYFQLSAAPGDLELDPARDYLYACLQGATQLARIDLATGTVVNIPLSGIAGSITLANNGLVFASIASSYWGPVSIVDGPNGTELKTLTTGASGFDRLLIYDRVRDVLITGSAGLSPSSLTRYQYDPAAKTLTQIQQLWNAGSNGQELGISPDGAHLAFPNGSGNGTPGYTIYDYDITNLNTTFGMWNTGAYPRAIAWSPDGQRVIASNDSNLMLFNATTHASIQTYLLDFSSCSYYSVFRVGISKGGKIGYGLSNCGFSSTSSRLYWVLLP